MFKRLGFYAQDDYFAAIRGRDVNLGCVMSLNRAARNCTRRRFHNSDLLGGSPPQGNGGIFKPQLDG